MAKGRCRFDRLDHGAPTMILSQKRVVPRKPWTCAGCKRQFAIGAAHLAWKWLDLGSVETVRACDVCVAFHNECVDLPLDPTTALSDVIAAWPEEWEAIREKLEPRR